VLGNLERLLDFKQAISMSYFASAFDPPSHGMLDHHFYSRYGVSFNSSVAQNRRKALVADQYAGIFMPLPYCEGCLSYSEISSGQSYK
jgi:hypothetical protein